MEQHTPEEIDRLKQSWRADPCWDIEDTDGFSAYYDELKAYHEQMREQWRRERYDEIDSKATALRCSFELAEYLMRLEARINRLDLH